MASNDDDLVSNASGNESFAEVVAARLSRRGFIGGGLASAAVASMGGIGALMTAVPVSTKHGHRPLLGFQGIPVSSLDELIVPDGYTAKVLIAWGDPVSKGPRFRQDASNSAADQAQQWGMHNDGLVYFPLDGSTHGLLVQNNEYTDDVLLFPDGTANWTREKTHKSMHAHGVSVIEIARERLKSRDHDRRGGRDHDDDDDDRDDRRGHHDDKDKKDKHDDKHDDKYGDWYVVRPSKYARRITARTPMRIAGPAAGADSLRTSADPTGTHVFGTLNNCAMGFTPWGTYLACEENFNGYFRKNGPQTPLERRYGINADGAGYLWHTTDKRFRADEEPNEAHRFGWVVEFDPFDPGSVPVKRTALGRLKHEGAWVQEARDGRVVVYMGDDEQNKYIYRYVSRLPWRVARQRRSNPLDDGTLYVAKFHANGTGEWVPLVPENPALAGRSIEEILVNTRASADAVGATMMDRPEWIDTFPDKLTAVATLTNNSRRGTLPPSSNAPDGSSAASSSRPPLDAINPRGNTVAPTGNPYGHIITWSYRRDWTERTFTWDIFALCGDPSIPTHNSTIVGDKYGSPDGLYVAPSGRIWIQTDVSGSTVNSGAYAGFGNNQMLCADPVTRETRRFLVGPNVCEITGVFVTPDERTMFVGIQHPGEAPSGSNLPTNPKQYSSWPDGPTGGRPRSACVVITKDDGGQIGS